MVPSPVVCLPGLVPTGGRGDDVTRAEAWTSALAAVVPTNPTCVPDATKTTIDVTQQPDSCLAHGRNVGRLIAEAVQPFR